MATQRPIAPFLLSLLGGLWMLGTGRMMYGRMLGGVGRGTHHMMWQHGVISGLWWPWFGLLAGAIIVVSAIFLYLAPRHQRSLGTTILLTAVLNLFLGMGGILASGLAIAGGVLALTPQATSQE
ncbi:MAG: hypothetical protein AAFQ61_01720 [Cyanobacteria bacterium J06626_23]